MTFSVHTFSGNHTVPFYSPVYCWKQELATIMILAMDTQLSTPCHKLEASALRSWPPNPLDVVRG